jgi:hypothetical protein
VAVQPCLFIIPSEKPQPKEVEEPCQPSLRSGHGLKPQGRGRTPARFGVVVKTGLGVARDAVTRGGVRSAGTYARNAVTEVVELRKRWT